MVTAMSGVLRRLVRIPESIWKNTPIRIPFGGASVRSGSGTVSRQRTVLPTRKRIAGARKAACQMRKRKLQTSAAHPNATMSVRWSRVESRGWKVPDRLCQRGVHEFYRGCLSVPEKPVKITEKFTEDRLINGWLYGNMKI